jgi:hypothetical protein
MGSNPFMDAINSAPNPVPNFSDLLSQSANSFQAPHGIDVSQYQPGPFDFQLGGFVKAPSASSTTFNPATAQAAMKAASPSGGWNPLSFLGGLWNDVKNAAVGDYQHAKGFLEGAWHELTTPEGWKQGSGWNPLNAPFIQGALHPQQADQWMAQEHQNVNNAINKSSQPGLAKALERFAYGLGSTFLTDPLTYTPSAVFKGAGELAKMGANAAHLPQLADLVKQAVKDSSAYHTVTNSKVVQGAKQTAQSIKDGLGQLFVKYYGANPATKQILQNRDALFNTHVTNIDNAMKSVMQKHQLTPEEWDNLQHAWEGTQQPINNKVSAAIQDFKNLLEHGPAGSVGQIGTKAELATKLNDQPILQRLVDNYFPHLYENTAEEVKQAMAGIPTRSFTTSGPFNQSRQFKTLEDAIAAGLTPSHPAMAIRNRLVQSARAITNANTINELLGRGLIDTKESPELVRSNVLNSLKWLDNTPKPVTETKTNMLKEALGSPPIDVNVSKPTAVDLNAEKFSLPKELAGAKPRYKSLPIEFANQFDKAAYIVGNTSNRSARDADYLKLLMDHTGLDEPSVRALGQTVRDTLKEYAAKAEGSTIKLPQVLKTYAPKEYAQETAAAAEAHVPSPEDVKDDSYFNSLLATLPQESKRVSYYVNPNDETAFKQALQETTNKNPLLDLYDKGLGAWKTATLYNPLIHGHNIAFNGLYLGGAKLGDVANAFKQIRNNPSGYSLYQRALRAGAISADTGSSKSAFEKAIKAANSPERQSAKALKKIADGAKYLSHGLLWDSDKAIRTALFQKGLEQGMTDQEAANMVNHYMVDYNNTTPFEQQFMSRIFPFYRWTKGNTLTQAKEFLNNPRKAALYGSAVNAASQGISGQNAQDGKINTGIQFPGGYNLMVDPYAPVEDLTKLAREGVGAWAYSKANPIVKEIADQLTNRAYYPGQAFAPEGKQSMADQTIGIKGAPSGFNAEERTSHAIQNLLPFGGFFSKLYNDAIGLPKSSKPEAPLSDKALQVVLNLLGTFPSTDNPAMDNYYNQKDQQAQLQGFVKYLEKIGQKPSKQLTQQEYAKIPFPGGQ